MILWLVSREYASIAEAGGVKNVACSLAESLVRQGNKVCLFIPVYGCTDFSLVEDFIEDWRNPVSFYISGEKTEVTFSHGSMNGVEIVFVRHLAFAEKRGVYTYTQEEQEENPVHRKGEGHLDKDYLNTLFQKAIAYYAKNCSVDERPNIIHCQDAPASLLPALIPFQDEVKDFFQETKFVVTIHNAGPGYHHEFESLEEAKRITDLPEEVLEYGRNGRRIEPFILASKNACITTVSPEYAREILSSETDTDGLSSIFRTNKTKIIGITNGIDFFKYDPSSQKKSLLPFAFNPEINDLDGKYKCRNFFLENFASKRESGWDQEVEGVVRYGFISNEEPEDKFIYISYHGRVVQQKGIEVMIHAAERLFNASLPVRFIFAGQGSPELERNLTDFAEKNLGKCVYFKGYNKSLSRLVTATADFSLHPSYFEPCGLEDFIAQTFGTLPVAHATGGLCKIDNDETGWLYSPNTSEKMISVLEPLVKIMLYAGRDVFRRMISYSARHVHEKYSWDKVALEYIRLYKSL